MHSQHNLTVRKLIACLCVLCTRYSDIVNKMVSYAFFVLKVHTRGCSAH